MKVNRPFLTLYKIFVKRVPIEAQLIVTRRCNLSCGYCSEYDHKSQPIPSKVLKERIDVLHRLGVINIALLGGEPLLHPEIDDIVHYAGKMAQVSITTNGFLLSEGLIKKLNRAGLTNMQVSIDALTPTPDLYIQKSYKSLAPKLQRLKELAAFAFHVKIVICETNRSDVVPMIAMFNRLQIPVSVNLVHNDHGCIAIAGKAYLELWDEAYRSAPALAFAEYEYGRKLLQGEFPDWLCRAGARFLYIDEFGRVQFCSQQRGRLNKPITEYTHQDIRRYYKQRKGCEAGCAVFCVYRASLVDTPSRTWLLILRRLLFNKRSGHKTQPVKKFQKVHVEG
ncbi:MAG: radical SAM protein [Calditrichaeota bacterium]|nr:MAG: radical SAM protein [Calditrichota bacterium]